MVQNVPKCSKMYAECSRMFQNVCRMHEDPWACMQLHKLPFSYISLHEITEACMLLQKLACSYISLNAIPWTYMKFHELTRSSLSLQAVSRACNCMQFHELVCSSFLCLSSSQEFRSACSNIVSLKYSILCNKVNGSRWQGVRGYSNKSASYQMFMLYAKLGDIPWVRLGVLRGPNPPKKLARVVLVHYRDMINGFALLDSEFRGHLRLWIWTHTYQ